MTNTSNSKRGSPKGWLPTSLRGLFTLFMCWVFMVSSTFAATEQVTYIHTDISGSPMAATDAAGTILWRESYRGYGERWMNQPASYQQNQWFHGKELDATGMQYFGARYYDPEIGRFTGIDPVGFQEGNPHSFNRFAYGNNNPIKYNDPDGKFAIQALFTVAILAIGGLWYASKPQSEKERMGQQIGITIDSFPSRDRSGLIFNQNNEPTPADNSDTAVGDLISGTTPEVDKKNRPVKGHYVKPPGEDAVQDLKNLPGTAAPNGQKILPDGSTAGIHTSTTTGHQTIHIDRPSGKRDVKIRYPDK